MLVSANLQEMFFARQRQSAGDGLFSPAPIYGKGALRARANQMKIGLLARSNRHGHFARLRRSTGNWLCSPGPTYKKRTLLASANLLEMSFVRQPQSTGKRLCSPAPVYKKYRVGSTVPAPPGVWQGSMAPQLQLQLQHQRPKI